MPLHIDYRPKTLEELYGNESVKASIASILARKDRPRAFLLTGPSGTGKTTLARILAAEYGCAMDTEYQELNLAQIGGKDESGRIQREMLWAPMNGPVRVYCLDECQDTSPAFQAGILKALEDTPKHVLFILCTTDPQRLKKTIHTRCSRFEMSLLNQSQICSLLRDVTTKEGITDYPEDIINKIANAAEGCPRQALVILDQVIDLPTVEEAIEAINLYTVSEASGIALCQALLKKNWAGCHQQLKNIDPKANMESIRQTILTYMRKVLLGDRPSHQAYHVIKAFETPFFNSGVSGFVAACWQATQF